MSPRAQMPGARTDIHRSIEFNAHVSVLPAVIPRHLHLRCAAAAFDIGPYYEPWAGQVLATAPVMGLLASHRANMPSN